MRTSRLLERPHPVGAERLEERELGLDRDDVRRDGVDDAAAEPADRCRRGLAAQLDGKQVQPRVEADDQLRAFALDGLCEAVGKDRGRRSQAGVEILRHRLLG